MIRFAVIGCGTIAQKCTIPALMHSGQSMVSVCVDINPKKEEEISNKFELPFETSLDLALKKYKVDAVYISTSNATHKNMIIKAAKSKLHIICEKPGVISSIEANEVVGCCKSNGVALFEGFMYQFHTQHEIVRQMIANDAIGRPFHYQAWFGFPPLPENDFRYNKNSGGGAMLDAGPYTIHSARHFFNTEPIKVSAVIENEGKEVDVRGSVMLDFGESRTAHLVFGFNNMYQNKYSIWGTKGVLTLSRAFAVPPDFSSTLILEQQGKVQEFKMEPCDHFIEEIKYFVNNMFDGSFVSSWQNEIINQAKVMDRIRGIL